MNDSLELLNEAASAWWDYLLIAGWQSGLAACVALALVAIGRRWPSPLRYGLLLIALLKFAAPPLVSAPWSVFAPAEAPRVESAAPSAIASPPIPTTLRPDRIPMDRGRMSGSSILPNAPLDGAASTPSPVRHGPADALAKVHWKAWLMLIHLFGALAVLGWIGLQVQRLRRAIRTGEEWSDPGIDRALNEFCSLLGLRRKPRVIILEGDFSPAAFGVLHPTILLPASLLESASPTALRTVLAHELAHFRRGDLLVNWLQLLLQAVWWFNPIYALLSRKIRQTREDCCDDLLLARGVVSGEVCCEALLEAAGSLGGRQPIGAALGFAERLHPLGRRLTRLMDPRLVRRAGISRGGLVSLTVLAFLFLPGARTPMTGTSQPLPPGPQWTDSRVPVYNTGGAADYRLKGIVVDEAGQGVSGATVKARIGPPEESIQTSTDDEGRFTLEGLREHVVVETTSDDHAPHATSIQFVSPTQEIRIKLIRGYPIRFRVVDRAGNPVPDVRVTFQGGGIPGRIGFTDGEGRYEWKHAPFAELFINFEKPGYMEGFENLRPSKEERQVILDPALRISGVVTDAETGEPIPKFLAVQGRHRSSGEIEEGQAWDESDYVVEGADGVFSTEFTERRRSPRYVRIDAEGYAPAILGPFTPEEGDRQVEVRLERPRPIDVKILSPNGEPVSNAEVALVSRLEHALTTEAGPIKFGPDTPTVQSDENGRVRIDPSLEMNRVTVIHASGVASLRVDDLREQGVITLEPWGRIEGKTRKGPDPDPKASLHVEKYDQPIFFAQIQSDAEGRFLIENAPPGVYTFSKLDPGSVTTWSQVEVAQVAPGESIEVSLGGKGRPVVGRIDIPEQWKGSFNPQGRSAVLFHSFPPPDELRLLREQRTPEAEERIKEWMLSPDGRAYTRRSTMFHFNIEPDGSFRIEDVQPGECRINSGAVFHGAPPVDPQRSPVSFFHEFTIPEIPSGRTDEPLDLGVIPVRIHRQTQVGDAFADLTLHRSESETVRIEDLRGKVVVLAFWTEGIVGRSAADDRWRETLLELAGMESTEEIPVCLHVHLSRFKPESLSPPLIHPGVIEAHLFGEEWDAAVRSTPGIDVGALLVLDRSGKILLRDSHPAEVLRVVKAALANP